MKRFTVQAFLLSLLAVLSVGCSKEEVFQEEITESNVSKDTRADAEVTRFLVDGIYYKITSETEVAVTNENGKTGYYNNNITNYQGEITIPEFVEIKDNFYFVTSIDRNAFSGASYLKKVIIPKTVKEIGEDAFYDCAGLESVVIGEKVKEIGYNAFGWCMSLTEIRIPDSVENLAQAAFSGSTNLTKFESKYATKDHRCLIKDGVLLACATGGLTSFSITESVTESNIGSVTEIGEWAFENSKLVSIEIPNTVTKIGRTAFANCQNLTSVNIPESVTTIVFGAFSGCTSLMSVKIPKNVTEIGGLAFEGCTNLTSVTIDNATTPIGSDAFRDCVKLTSVDLGENVTSIGEQAFKGCTSMSSIYLGESATTIGKKAFEDCGQLTSFVIPNSVTKVGDNILDGCNSLTSITIGEKVDTMFQTFLFYNLVEIISLNPTPPCIGDYNGVAYSAQNNIPNHVVYFSHYFHVVDKSKLVLRVPAGSEEAYRKAEGWSALSNIVAIDNKDYTTYDITDGEPYAETSDHHVGTLTYTRNFANTNWAPLYIPFSMSYEEWNNKGVVIAELAGVHMYEDGRIIIEFSTLGEGKELLPNVPYVIRPKATGKVTFNLSNKTLKAAPAERAKYISCGSPRWTYKIYGNYQPIQGSVLNTYGELDGVKPYAMSGTKFMHASATATLKAGRFYLVKTKSANGYWPETRSDESDEIFIMVDGKLISEEN